MRRSAWLVLLSAATIVGSVGCGDDDGTVIPVDANVGDAGPPVGDGGGDGGPVACGATGTVGGLCRAGACQAGLDCVQGVGASVREGLGIAQAEPTDDTNSVFRPVATPSATNDVPLRFLAGDMCVRQCDTTSTSNMCGSCASCSDEVGYDAVGLNPGWWLDLIDEAQYGREETGVCRPHCTFDPETNGGCPTGYTCDPSSNLCVEGCLTDAHCNAVLVISEDGEYGTWIADAGRTCNRTTGRCEWTNSQTETVGNTCTAQSDCAADVGTCIAGGTCAEFECGRASDTTSEGVCDGGNGVCLPWGGNDATICLQGCATANDCNPGNACSPLADSSGNPVNVGGFTGVCFPVCDADSPCRTGEQCDENAPRFAQCRPPCDPDGTPTGCEADELCEAVEGRDYGFCRPLNDFCYEPGTEDCYGGQICDNAIGAATFGRCVDACTPGSVVDVCEGVPAADRCTTATTECDEDELVTCAPNAQGCLVTTRTTCTEGCTGEAGAAECTVADTCETPAPCTAGRSCNGDDLVICAPDASGCLVETTVTCDESCSDAGGTAVCTVEGTPSSCEGGDVCVTEGDLAGLCATPCTMANATTVCGTGRTCRIAAGATSGVCVQTTP